MKLIIPTFILLISISIFASDNNNTKTTLLLKRIKLEGVEAIQAFNKI